MTIYIKNLSTIYQISGFSFPISIAVLRGLLETIYFYNFFIFILSIIVIYIIVLKSIISINNAILCYYYSQEVKTKGVEMLKQALKPSVKDGIVSYDTENNEEIMAKKCLDLYMKSRRNYDKK